MWVDRNSPKTPFRSPDRARLSQVRELAHDQVTQALQAEPGRGCTAFAPSPPQSQLLPKDVDAAQRNAAPKASSSRGSGC